VARRPRICHSEIANKGHINGEKIGHVDGGVQKDLGEERGDGIKLEDRGLGAQGNADRVRKVVAVGLGLPKKGNR